MSAGSSGGITNGQDREPQSPAGPRTHLVQFSTGVSAAEAAFRAVEHFGAENVELLTADTRVEDEDNWRFAVEVVEALPGVRWVVLCDGRTPMQVGRDHRVVPNNRMAVCSRVLKRELIRSYLDEHHDPASCVVHLGFDAGEAGRWHDSHARVTCVACRAAKPGTCPEHHRIVCPFPFCDFKVSEAQDNPWGPWQLAWPLNVPPLFLSKTQMLEHMRDVRGIEPPLLYLSGAPHANCGGACVRGGQVEWERLLWSNRNRYLEWEAEEEETRSLLGKDVAILRDRRGGTLVPLPLRRFRERLEETPSLFDTGDTGACSCYGDDEEPAA